MEVPEKIGVGKAFARSEAIDNPHPAPQNSGTLPQPPLRVNTAVVAETERAWEQSPSPFCGCTLGRRCAPGVPCGRESHTPTCLERYHNPPQLSSTKQPPTHG